jgi:hypothetical protein
MKKKLLYYSFITSLMIGSLLAFNSVGKKGNNVRAEQPGGAPQLKLTWDFSAATNTSTTPLNADALKTFIETHDAPSFTYTIVATANTYIGTGTGDAYPDDNWKFSSSSKQGSATISGLPEYGYVKVWAYQWGSDAAKLSINDGTAVSITGNVYSLYEFDVADTTTFKITAQKRSLIQKIEFWGC